MLLNLSEHRPQEGLIYITFLYRKDVENIYFYLFTEQEGEKNKKQNGEENGKYNKKDGLNLSHSREKEV